MRTLVLVRHGETEWNSDNRVQGSVDVPLSEEGLRQASALAEFLRANGFTMDIDPQQSRYFAQDNAAMSVFQWVRGRVYCLAWNVVCHIKDSEE